MFLVDGVILENWVGTEISDFERIVLLFDGGEGNALDDARSAWKRAKEAGHQVTYWKESSAGRWEKQV